MTKFTLEAIAGRPWAPAFIREFELVVASNVFEATAKSENLSDTILNTRTGDFVRHLDGDLEERFLGIIPVPDVAGEQFYQTHRNMLAELAQHPRGHWAIYQSSAGKFDAYISNGVGGTATESGNKFQYNSPDIFSFDEVYGTILSEPCYKFRSRVGNEIVEATLAAAGVEPGSIHKKVQFQGHEWSNFVFIRRNPRHYVGGGDSYVVRMSRRGVAAKDVELSPSEFARALKLPQVLPAKYDDPENPNRLRSLRELRRDAAQAAWNRLLDCANLSVIEQLKTIGSFDVAEETSFSRFASRVAFRTVGDVLSRTVYTFGADGGDYPTHLNVVTFAPGSDKIIRNIIVSKESPLAHAA